MTASGPLVFELTGGLDLASGRRLEHVSVTYETFGELDEAWHQRGALCHALSGDAHAAAGPDRFGEIVPGWWDPVVGPARRSIPRSTS
jgi:homoserine O-acetyltransferase/O-succinyltransferase